MWVCRAVGVDKPGPRQQVHAWGCPEQVPLWLPALLGLLLLALGRLHTQLWFTGAVLTQVLPSFERGPIRALELRIVH